MDILRLNKRYYPANERSTKRFFRQGNTPGQEVQPEKSTVVDTGLWLKEYFEKLHSVPGTRFKIESNVVFVVSKDPQRHLSVLRIVRILSHGLNKYGGLLLLEHKDDCRTKLTIKPYKGSIPELWDNGTRLATITCSNGTTIMLSRLLDSTTVLTLDSINGTISAVVNKDTLNELSQALEDLL